MKKKFISLLLAFLMIVTALPLPVFAQNAGPVSEELVELDYEFERIDGQDYLKVTLPANSVEVVEDPYAIRPMSITDTVPTQDGAGQLINWGAGVLWNDWNNAFPPNGKGYVAELIKDDNGTDVVVATANITTAATSTADMKIDKNTTFQFVTTDDYKVGDDQLSLVVSFPVKLEQNVIYNVKHKFSSGKLNGTNHGYHLVFLAVTRLTSPVYTAEWDTTVGALKPTLKGKLITGTNAEAIFDIFDNNYKYGNIIDKQTYPKGYIDEKDKDGNLIDVKTFDANGSLSPNDVLWSKGSTPVMSGQFLSYTQFENGANVDKPLGNTKGQIPGFTETKFDYQAGGLKTSKYPPYFYNLVGDNDHMWRFQMKEGLEVKFNTGVGMLNESGEAGQDIGQASTIAYGEKFDTNLKGAFSENTITLPTANPVAPTLNKNNVNLTFKGWKLVEGKEEPRNPQEIKTDNEGKQTLTEVTPDYATTDALKAALSDSNFKGFTGKNPVFYAIFGQTQGKAKIQYVDDKGTDLLKDEFKIQGQDYKTEKLGELNEAVTATTDEAPQFKGYAINKVEIEPTTDAKYVDPATATIKFVYKVKATTEDKSSDNDYIKVTFDANEGHFGQITTDTTKDVYVLKDKATFADAKEKVSNPTKDNADFKEWQTAKISGQTVADDKTLSTADETFYANYEEKLPGKATVEYLDVKTGKEIKDDYRAEDVDKYPAEKEGKQGEKISADVYTKDTAPKFVGYEFNRVEISPKDGAYALPGTSVIKVYYNKLDDIIPDNTPDTDDDKPDGYVTVKFLADDDTHTGENARGTLSGETKFYVNPKAGKTNADITEPTIKAKTGFTVKENDGKWSPKFDKTSTDFITADATYIAQYKDGDDVIPVPDPSNPPEKPEGYVTVTFDLDGKGTTTDTKEFYVNPNKEVEITAPTVKGINNYEQKTGNDAWSPKFVAKAKYDKDTTFVAQYNFTKDVVPQGPGEDKPVVPDNYVKVEFKNGDHGTILKNQITIYWVNPEKEVDLIEKAPLVQANAEYKHTGWDKPLKAKFTTATDITAKYLKKVLDKEPTEDADKYVKVDFKAKTHGKIKDGEKTEYWVLKDETVEIKTPAVEAKTNYAFKEWDPAVQTSYSDNTTHNAVFVYTGEDVVPQPGDDKPDVPDNFVQVVFEKGTNGEFADGATTTYWVNPEKEVTVTAPAVTANDDYKHVAWTYGTKEVKTLESVTDKFTEKKTTITAKYLKKVVTDDPNDTTNYVKVSFSAEKDGKFADGATTTYWVLKDTPVTFDVPSVTANDNYKFIEWKPEVKASYSEDTEHKAQYKEIIVTKDPKDKDYVKVTFDPAAQGTIKKGSAEVWVLKDETIDPTKITPELEVKEKYAFKEWTPAVQTSYSADTKHTVIYKYNGDDVVPQEPGEDKPNVPDNFVKVTFVAGEHGSIANTETYIFWVNPEKQVTLNAPTVTAKEDYKHVAWTYKLKATDTDEKTTSGNNALTTVVDIFTEKETTITAKYKEKVVTTDPGDEDYVKVTFKAEANGKLASNKTETSVWVLKDTDVKVTPPEVTANSGYTFTEWSPAVKTQYGVDTEHEAQYKLKDKVVTEDPNDPDYIKVTFNANGGKIGIEDTKDLWVLKDIATFADAKERVATPTKDKATFKEWQNEASEGTKVADDKILSTDNEIFYAAYTDDAKIIEDPITPQPEDGYVRLTFDATKDGKINGKQTKVIDVLDTLKYSDKDLQDKIESIKAIPNNTTKKFNAWTPAVPADDTAVTEETYTANYVDKDKIIDVTPGTEDEDPDNAYVRFIFNAVGTDKENTKVNGTVKGNAKYAFDVLKGTKFSDNDLQTKINSLKAVAKDYKFIKWTPDVLNDDTLVEAGNVTKHEYTATYEKLEKIIDVTDPTVDPDEDYVRLTFDATKDGKIGDVNGQQTKAIDVLKGTPYTDQELIDKIASIKAIPVKADPNDANNKVADTEMTFDKWTPAVPTTGIVDTATFTASYKKVVPGQEQIDITATKTWQDDKGQTPTFTTPEVKFELWRKAGQAGTEEIVKQATALTNNSVTFSGVDKYDENNVEYTYFVKEVFTNTAEKDNWIVNGEGTLNLTNKLKGDPTDPKNPDDNTDKVAKLTITKVLENEPIVQAQTNGMRRAPKQALKFSFKVTGPYGYTNEFELTAGESKILENLAYGDYKVEEIDSKGYTAEYSKDKETLTMDSPNGSITVTNKNVKSTDPQDPSKPSGQVIDITVKKVWSDVPQGSTTPQVKIELWRKGYDLSNKEYEQKVDEFTTEANNTENEETHKFENLAKHDPSGRDFTYYAVEPNVPANYKATYSTDKLTVTNNYEAPPTPAKEYTVTYAKGADAATGTMNPVTVTENTDHTVLANGFTNEGYTFKGWKVGDTTTIVQPGATINVTADVTLTAQWEKAQIPPTPGTDPTDFTINYYSADSSMGYVSPTSETVEITGGTIDGSTATAYSGYRFVRWTRNGIQVSTDAKFVPTSREAATYIAVFEKVGSVIPPTPSDTFTIHYVARYDDMGWVSRDYEVVENPYGTIMGSTAITRNGYRFVKWVDEYGDTVSRYERFVPYERREAKYFAIFERDYPYDPYYPDHRPDDRPNRPDDRYDRDDRDDRDDHSDRKPGDTRPVLDHEAYMFGYTDGTVRPNGNITRAEAAALVTRLLGIEAYASAAKPNFPDTPSAWYNKAINAAVERGIMKGYPDGRFRPNAPITRAEFTQMISTIDNKPYGVAPFADVVGHWAERPIGSEYQAGRITGYPDGLFRPNAYITRCEAVVILNKIFERNYDELSPINAINAERIKRFIDLAPSFWGYNDMVEATNSHSFKRRVQGRIEEDWVLVK
ncbi:S-layer homology domain-containing protein [uncultured Fenollaria sp.]|uniref:S-layer homology domain-containing protein n=1 Tax=uncultured Fenollaria sp. TaxID=1686315 RepID=UPI0025F328CF|nr:S-layer homology domain-containing protein [uncultured Fenollaria sp.]